MMKSFCRAYVVIGLAILVLPWQVSCDKALERKSEKESLRLKTKFKIVNWNVLYGFRNGKSLEAGSKWLQERAPDVVALQELNGISEKQLVALSKDWGHQYATTHKETGFPVGLTSNSPIEVIEKVSKGFHHGYLHCKTHEIHFFVVHFWPGKEHELDTILAQVKPLLKAEENVVILGDFNACSRHDMQFLANVKHREIDFELTDKVEKMGFVDVICKTDPDAKISCPSPVTIPQWSANMEVLKSKQYRIDFVFADESLGKSASAGTIRTEKILDSISDHYPVVVEFLR